VEEAREPENEREDDIQDEMKADTLLEANRERGEQDGDDHEEEFVGFAV